MNRVKILALLATVALLALLPVGLFAQQPDAPHQFYGTATMADGSVAPDGTVVAAWVGGVEVATTTVDSSFQAGFYLLKVTAEPGETSFAGQNVTFTIDGVATDDSIPWVSLATNKDLILTAVGAMMEVGGSLTIGLFGNNSSGQSGMATLTEIGDDLQVVLSLNPGALNTNLAHIHDGTCEAVGPVGHGLTPFGDAGFGETTMLLEGITLAHVQDGAHYINLHWAENAGVSTACGNIPMEGDPQPLPVKKAAVDTDALTDDVKTALMGDGVFVGLLGGRDGRNGADGADGVDGSQGPPGLQGGQGAQGAQGNPGAAGPSGQAGADGANGQAGAIGPQGDSGGVALAIVALILAIVALVGAGGAFLMSRRS